MKKVPSKRLHVRVYIGEKSLLYKILEPLANEPERREALLGLANIQAIRQLPAVYHGLSGFVDAAPPEAAGLVAAASPRVSPPPTPVASPRSMDGFGPGSHLDPSVSLQFS